MQRLLVNVLGRLSAGVIGLVAGFFVAFNAVFTDVFGFGDMLGAVAYVLVSYTLLGLLFGVLGRTTGVRWALWLAPPGLVLVAFSLLDSTERIPYIASVVVAVVVGSLGGAWAGMRLSAFVARIRQGEPRSGGAPV
jgi:hypothetical protein